MNAFLIGGKQGFIRIEIIEVFGFPNETSYLGGYEVKGKIDIKSGNYFVKDAELWFSTGQIYTFFSQLQKCFKQLNGSVTFTDSSSNIEFEMHFNRLGQITIEGYFQEFLSEENKLHFEFESEQSYLLSSFEELRKIVAHYGGLEGKRR
ncbi:WapI family immunity protein [Lysinibacillus sp. NPDC097214]|uniref:WapI family immunity protein n=1 Tax=unclassified Lysinibacillus TaxID=2636778 RepID=UPI003D069EFB